MQSLPNKYKSANTDPTDMDQLFYDFPKSLFLSLWFHLLYHKTVEYKNSLSRWSFKIECNIQKLWSFQCSESQVQVAKHGGIEHFSFNSLYILVETLWFYILPQ